MDAVSEAFRAVPRHGFLPRSERGRASYDGPIAIGDGQTNSQPRTVDAMLRLLDVDRGMRVLDVGAGSGWTTALLAELVGPTGSVLGVEIAPRLVAWGSANLAAAQFPWASIVEASPGVLGRPERAPYDRILVSADAPAMPGPLTRPARRPGPAGGAGALADDAGRAAGRGAGGQPPRVLPVRALAVTWWA